MQVRVMCRGGVQRLGVIVAILAVPQGAAAQSGGLPPVLLDSLLVGLERPLPLGTVLAQDPCRGQRGDAAALCEGLALVRRAVNAPDSMAETRRGVVVLRGPTQHPQFQALQEGYRHGLSARDRLAAVTRAQPTWGAAWYGLAHLALAKGAPIDSIEHLLAQAQAGEGVPPGLVALLRARLRFRDGDTTGAWQAWAAVRADSAPVTVAAAGANVRQILPLDTIVAWDTRPAGEVVAEVSESALYRSVLQFHLMQAHSWIPILATSRGYLVFWHGRPVLVGVFALPRAQLVREVPQAEDDPAVTVYPFRLGQALARSDGTPFQVRDTLYRLRSSLPPPWQHKPALTPQLQQKYPWERVGTPDGYIGFIPILPGPDSLTVGLSIQQVLPDGVSSAVLVRLEQTGGRGRTVTFLPRVVSLDGGLFASDLVLGMPGRGYTWRSAERWVPMHPTGIYPAGATLSLFTQLRGLTPDTTYQVMLELLEDTEAANARVLLTVRSTEEARAEDAEWYKQVQLVDMKPGRYRVRVTFRQGSAEVMREDRMTIVR